MKERTNRKEVEALLYTMGRKMLFNQSTFAKMFSQGTTADLVFFLHLLKEEDAIRTENRRTRYQRLAHFPTPKSFTNYDFSGISFPTKLEKEELLSLNFIQRKEVIIFFGACGTGKTHAMTALGINACNSDYRVRFYTVSELILFLKKAKEENHLEKFYSTLGKQDLLCIDELGYIPMDVEAGQLLFQVISKAYERQSLIITTNLPFNAWGPLFADEQLAAAIIDRLIHHGHLIKTGTKDWRLLHSTMLEK